MHASGKVKPFSKNSEQPPDYLELTTKGIVVVTLILIIPFGIYSYFEERYLFALATLAFLSICILYLWTCKQGRCNRTFIAYPVAPLMMISIPLIVYKLGVIGVYWSLPGSIALYFLLTRKWAIIANIFFAIALFSVAWVVLDIQLITRFMVVLIGVNVFSAISVSIINKQYAQLTLEAVTDPLTKLYSRSLLQQSLEYAKHQYSRTGVVMSLITMDLDNFKSINDDLGHDTGDLVLQSFSELLKQSFRGTDMIFRIGGEEFLTLAYDANENKAATIAEKFRHIVEQQNLLPDRRITVSIGVAEIIPQEDCNQWLARCDQKLYQAKRLGRNQVAL